VVILSTCGFVAFVGWILAAGVSDLGPGDPAPGAGPASDGSDLFAALVLVPRPLPREWRTWGTAYDFDRMYREEESEKKRR